MDRTSWLDTAVSGIRFGPDRKAVRAELEGHIEDKTADLRRIFPGIPEEEARERALSGMGDPEELKISLAKVHRPWLGRLWTASRWALWVTLLALNLIALWYYLRGDGWSASGEKGGTLGENMDGWKRWAKDFHIEGELLKEGGILFRVPVEDHESMEYELLRLLAKQNTYRQSAKVRGLNCHMQAVFYGQDGRELGRAALSTLEDGETSSVSG